MRFYTLIFIVLNVLFTNIVFAEEQLQEVQVADPFLEVHTGAAASFPIFYVVKRGDWITIKKQRTEWYKIVSQKKIEGWVHRSQMAETLTHTGEKMQFKDITRENYLEHKWETGAIGGDFQGSSMMTLYTDFQLTNNLAAEVALSQILGNYSSRNMLNIQLLHQPFPDWKISPYFLLGTGLIKTSVRSTLAQLDDDTDWLSHYGFGFKMYLTRRFVLRADYKRHIIFQSRDANEVIRSWQFGFAFFY